jgi:hypothetical protein
MFEISRHGKRMKSKRLENHGRNAEMKVEGA